MSVLSRLPLWLRAGDTRPITEIEADVREELETHIAMLADENERCGMSAEQAYEEAVQRFGDTDRYTAECTQVHAGDRIMLQRIMLALVVLLIVAVGVLGWQATELGRGQQETQALLERNQEQMELIGQRLEAVAVEPTLNEKVEPAPVVMGDVTGNVFDASGGVVENAEVLVIVKTWPNSKFRMQTFSTKSDVQGRFALPAATPLNRKHSLLVSAVKNGYTLESSYKNDPGDVMQGISPYKFFLTEAVPLSLSIINEKEEPISGATLFVSERRTIERGDHLIYHNGSKPIWHTTDASGKASLAYGVKGDILEIAYSPPKSNKWYSREVLVPPEGEEFKLVADGDPSDDSTELLQ